jgi:membrane-associated phospholipid phosphatase
MVPMGSSNKIAPRLSNAATDTVRLFTARYERGAATARRLWFRLSRPVRDGMSPVWTPRMTWIAVTAIGLTAFAAIFDPYFRPFAGPAPNFALQFLRHVTDAAKSGWYIIPAIIVIAIIGLMDWREIRSASRRALLAAYGQAAYILAAIAIPGIAVNIVKQIVGRARPRMIEEFGVYGFAPFQFDSAFQSFPSGHAATAGSLAVILMLWHPRAKWPLFAAMALLACARIPAGAHYPSDVVAGFSIGALGALALARWLARRRSVFSFSGEGTFPRLIR